MADCQIEGCDAESFSRGYCQKHYSRWKRHGDPLATSRTPPAARTYAGAPCVVDGCDRSATKRQMCNMHYQRVRESGTTGEAETRRTSREGPCSVDGCEKPIAGAGLCGMHYYRQATRGEVGAAESTRRSGCSIEGCERGHQARGYCALHYRQRLARGEFGHDRCSRASCESPGILKGMCRKHYEVAERKARPKPACSIEGCGRPSQCKGLCGLHYGRLLRNGDPGPAGRLKAADGEGWTGARGYRVIRKVAEHKMVMEQMLGRPLLPREQVHHKNGVRSDNRPENLELWVKPQPAGQRVVDLVDWVVEMYPDYVKAAIEGHPRLFP